MWKWNYQHVTSVGQRKNLSPDRIIPFFSFLTEKRVVFVFTLRASDPWRRSSAVGSCLVPSLFFSLYNINGQYWWEKHGYELFDHRLKCLRVSAFKLVQLLCLKVIPLYIQLRRVAEKYRRLCSGVGGGGEEASLCPTLRSYIFVWGAILHFQTWQLYKSKAALSSEIDGFSCPCQSWKNRWKFYWA